MSVWFSHRFILIVMILALLETRVVACGPDFPNRVLLGGDNIMLKAPIANFRKEIELVKPPVPSRFKAIVPSKEDERKYYLEDERRHNQTGKPRLYSYGDRYHRQTAVADLTDLEKALAQSNLAKRKRDKIIEEYRAARKILLDYDTAISNWKYTISGWKYRRGIFDPNDLPRPRFNPPEIPEGLPVEFVDYLRGAILYHQGEREKAIEVWLELLKLPKEQRLYRSTWAAFMIGKAMLDENPAVSIRWFQRVRQFAEEGYMDSLGLASSSLGWEARALLDMQSYEQAIELYVAQMATGDPTAIVSLQWTAGKALKTSPEVLEKIARNDTARRVITAYVISRRFPKKLIHKWLEAVEAADVSAVEEADRLALASYQAGEMEIASRWVDIAPTDSIMPHWLRAKLLLRDGKVLEAAEHLAFIARCFPPVPKLSQRHYDPKPVEVQVRGELGVLYLARQQYVEALDVLLRGGHWEDAAYIAERVLTPDELTEYVNLKWLPPEQDDPSGNSYMSRHNTGPDWFKVRIRYLLARRLSRLGRWDEARHYYPSKWQTHFDAYVQAVQNGQNQRLSNKERAAALWKAACIARYEGMELMGTEVEPDWFFYGGHFQRTPTSLIRGSNEYAKAVASSELKQQHSLYATHIRNLDHFEEMRQRMDSAKFALSSDDEQRRIQQHVTRPEMRFHYRYKAIDFAWQAVELMPDDSDDTARVLCIAGLWLAKLNPQAADRFYKVLVIRCGKTELGKEADRLRWFPKIEIDKKKLLQ